MSYSEDLRERVVEYVRKGGAKSKAARILGVSRWCVYNWLGRENLAAEQSGPKKAWKLNMDELEAHVDAYPDAYQYERAEALGVSRQVVLYGLKRLGIKKNVSLQRKRRQTS